MKGELCKDKDGWPIGLEFFVRVQPRVGRRYRGWVEGYDSNSRVLSIRDERTSSVRPTRPEFCTVVKPTTLSTARRIGQRKTSEAASVTANKNRRVRTGKKEKK
jgi:hypothetical protein